MILTFHIVILFHDIMSLHDFMIYFTLHIDLERQQYNPLVEVIARSVNSHVNSCKFNIDQFMILS